MPRRGREEIMAATIKSVEKAIDLLFLFDGDRSVMDVKTIARTLGIPLRTTYRLANTLRNRSVLTIEERTGLCRLGPRLRSLLAAIDDSADIPRLSKEKTSHSSAPDLRQISAALAKLSALFIRQSFFSAKVYLAYNRTHVEINDIAPIDHRNSAPLGNSTSAGRIRVIIRVGICSTFNADTRDAPRHLIECGIILKNIEVVARDFDQGLTVAALVWRDNVPFLRRRVLQVIVGIEKPVVLIADEAFNLRNLVVLDLQTRSDDIRVAGFGADYLRVGLTNVDIKQAAMEINMQRRLPDALPEWDFFPSFDVLSLFGQRHL